MMTDDDIRAWLAKHGGLDGEPRYAQTGQGIYLARDGSRLVVTPQADNTYRVDENQEQGSEAATPAAPAPQAPARGGGAVALDPNEEVAHLTGYDDDPDHWPEKLPAGVEKDKDKYYAHKRTYRDGRVVWQFFQRKTSAGEGQPDTVVATLNEVNVKVQDAWKKDTKDAEAQQVRGDQEGDIRGPQTGPTREVYRGGKWAVEPNPVYQAPASAAQTPAQIANTEATTAHTQATTAATIKEEAEKDANAARGRGRLTDEKWAAENTRRQAEARAAGQQDRANQLAAERLAFDREREARPDVKVEEKKGSDGKTYFIRTVTPKDGKTAPTITTYGADGKEVPGGIPGEGAGTAYQGPKLPRFVAGQAAAALQAIGEAIMADPNMTPPQRTAYWNQVVQTANIAVTEAGVLEREREANLNAEVNLATTRLTAGQNMYNAATKLALDLNDKLPVGSSLAGQAFAAALGMQMIQARHSGIYDIKPPGTPIASGAANAPAPAVTPLPFNPANRAEVETARQQTQAQLAAPPAPAPGGAPAPAAAAPPAINQATGEPTGLPGTPYAPAAAAAPPQPAAASSPTTPLADLPFSEWEAGLNDEVLVNNGQGAPIRVPRRSLGEGPGQYRPSQGWQIVGPAPINPPAGTPGSNPSAPVGKITNGMPTPSTPTTMPGADFAVLSQFRPSQEPRDAHPGDASYPIGVDESNPAWDDAHRPGSGPPPDRLGPAPYPPYRGGQAVPLVRQPGQAMPLAMLHAQAASKPPWRMSPEELAQYEAAGVPDDIVYGVPGVGRVA